MNQPFAEVTPWRLYGYESIPEAINTLHEAANGWGVDCCTQKVLALPGVEVAITPQVDVTDELNEARLSVRGTYQLDPTTGQPAHPQKRGIYNEVSITASGIVSGQLHPGWYKGEDHQAGTPYWKTRKFNGMFYQLPESDRAAIAGFLGEQQHIWEGSGIDRTAPTYHHREIKGVHLIGALASGKDTLAKPLSEALGAPIIHLSRLVVDIMTGKGLPFDMDEPRYRENYYFWGRWIVRHMGLAATATYAIAQAANEYPTIDTFVFNGARRIQDLQTMAQLCPDVVPVFLDVTEEELLRRAEGRKRGADPDEVQLLQSVLRHDMRDVGPLKHLPGVVVIDNNGDFPTLLQTAEEKLRGRGVLGTATLRAVE